MSLGKDDEKEQYPSTARDRLVGVIMVNLGRVRCFSGRREMKLLEDVILRDERKYGDDGWN